MLGAVFAGALKAARDKRKRRPRNPRTGLVKRKRRPAFLRGKKGRPMPDRYERYKRKRLKPKERSIKRVREQEKKKGIKTPRPGFAGVNRVSQVDFRDPDTGRRYGGKVVGGVPQFSKPDFVSDENFNRAIASVTSRRPRKPRGPRVHHADPRRTPGKPKSAGTTKRTPAQIALVNKYTHGDPKRTPGKPTSRVQEPSKTARVKERPSKVQPRVRKRRKSKGPSYTTNSLNV